MLLATIYFTGLFLWILLGAFTVAPATDYVWWSALLWGLGYAVIFTVAYVVLRLLNVL